MWSGLADWAGRFGWTPRPEADPRFAPSSLSPSLGQREDGDNESRLISTPSPAEPSYHLAAPGWGGCGRRGATALENSITTACELGERCKRAQAAWRCKAARGGAWRSPHPFPIGAAPLSPYSPSGRAEEGAATALWVKILALRASEPQRHRPSATGLPGVEPGVQPSSCCAPAAPSSRWEKLMLGMATSWIVQRQEQRKVKLPRTAHRPSVGRWAVGGGPERRGGRPPSRCPPAVRCALPIVRSAGAPLGSGPGPAIDHQMLKRSLFSGRAACLSLPPLQCVGEWGCRGSLTGRGKQHGSKALGVPRSVTCRAWQRHPPSRVSRAAPGLRELSPGDMPQ